MVFATFLLAIWASLGQIIAKILSAVPVRASEKLACDVRDGIITISTRDDLGPAPMILRRYEVGDLLNGPGHVIEEARARDVNATSGPAERRQSLVRLIIAALRMPEPEAGEEDPGSHIQIWADRLVVVQPYDGQKKVAGLLRVLRTLSATDGKSASNRAVAIRFAAVGEARQAGAVSSERRWCGFRADSGRCRRPRHRTAGRRAGAAT